MEEAFAIVEQELGIAISTGFDVTGIAARSASGGDDLVAAWHTFAQPLASVRRGTLRLTEADGGGLGVEIDLPDTEAGRAVLEAQAVAGIVSAARRFPEAVVRIRGAPGLRDASGAYVAGPTTERTLRASVQPPSPSPTPT